MSNIFHENDDRKAIVKDIIHKLESSLVEKEKTLYDNVIDPFSAIFDAIISNKSFDEWLSQEKARQVQKTLQNEIGYFHQRILATFDDWEDLGNGGVLDLCSTKHKIIAEIKNKFNTTNSSSRLGAYDNLNALLQREEYKGYTAYFVEIIPKNQKQYNEEFVPSDSKAKTKRPNNPNIRLIDGTSFYEIVTGEKDALRQCYDFALKELKEVLNYNGDLSSFDELFKRAFG
jgi:hypothetical protein